MQDAYHDDIERGGVRVVLKADVLAGERGKRARLTADLTTS